MPNIALRGDRLDQLLLAKGGDTNIAAAKILGLNDATVSRVRKRKAFPGEKFIASALTTLPATFDELFEIVDNDIGEAA